MKRKIISLLLIAAMLIPLPAMAEEAAQLPDSDNKNTFTDVDTNHAAYEAVMYLAQQGIINGKSKNTFAPEDSLKREEFAKILSNAFELSDGNNIPVFNDVLAATWYAPYIGKVSTSGLMQGIEKDKFGIGVPLSRQDLAVILKRFLDKEQVKYTAESTVLYADSSEIADYAKDAVSKLCGNNVMSAKENNLFAPKAEATRADAAIAIYNALKMKKEYVDSLGRMGPASQYYTIDPAPTDDRLAEAKPVPFDANIWPREEFIYEDFEDTDYGKLKILTGFDAGVAFDYENGYNSKGCLTISSSTGNILYPRFQYKSAPDELKPGDYLVFSTMIRTENLSGEGHARSLLAIHGDDSAWLSETSAPYIKTSTANHNEWNEYQWIIKVPEKLNDLDPDKFFILNFGGYIKDITGKVYFDDMKISIVRFDPMDTVLMTPNYKGIIKGDGGIGDIALRAYINGGNGFYNLDNMKVINRITDDEHKVYLESESETVTEVLDVYFSSDTLPMGGDFYLETILVDKTTGEEIQKKEWMLHKREADFTTTVDYDKYGRIIYKGEPVFPLSTYNSTHSNALDLIKMGCMDNMTNYGIGWYYSWGEDESYRNITEEMQKNGMTISLTIPDMRMDTTFKEVFNVCKDQNDRRSLVKKILDNMKDLPNLYTYYLFDEQNPMRYGDELGWIRKIIESEDLNHPTTCAIADPFTTRPGVYAEMSDFLGYDAYPVTGRPDQDISLVSDFLETSQKNNPNRPYYAILQAFYYNGRKDERAPNKIEFRNMAFQALCEKAAMIEIYGYYYIKGMPSPDRPWQETWADYESVLNEIKYLKPILLSTDPAPYYQVKGGDEWLKTRTIRHDGKSYLFTVNVLNEGKIAKVYLDGVTKIKGMYSKKVYEADSNGWFEIEWDGYESEIFEYEQEDYLSPHAEFKRFGLSDIVTIDSESVPCFIIPEGKTEVEYCAAISEFAKLYINGEEKEITGKLDISGLSEIKLKVVSQDGRFQTEKVYKLERK